MYLASSYTGVYGLDKLTKEQMDFHLGTLQECYMFYKCPCGGAIHNKDYFPSSNVSGNVIEMC